MPEFLSAAWIDALDEAAIPVDPALDFRLDQIVTGTPWGEVRYRLTLGGGRLRVAASSRDDPAADTTLVVNYETATGLATRSADASEAFAAGLVRFRGNLARLQGATTALVALAESLSALRTRTTFETAG